MNAGRKALALAAVFAATTLTGGAAILGITHRAPLAAPAVPAVVQPASQATSFEEGD
jgi:hypothetical protein